MSWNSSLKRKTPLRRKSRLRAHVKSLVTKVTRPAANEEAELTPDVIAAATLRAGGRCEYCALPFGVQAGPEFRVVRHHVFYRSRIWKLIKHELWNLVALHDLCHRKAHEVPAMRAKLEAIAIRRLYEYVGPERVKDILRQQRGSTPASFIRAYEQWRRWNQLAA